MTQHKETTLSRQANRVEHKGRKRLSQEEWERECRSLGPWLVAGFAVLCIVVTLMETGVAL